MAFACFAYIFRGVAAGALGLLLSTCLVDWEQLVASRM